MRVSDPGRAKVAIVGAGHVGCTLAHTLVVSGVAREIVLVDADRDRAEGEAMDLAQAVPFYAPVEVRSGEIPDTAGALVTVIAAGASQRPGETRLDLLRRNVDVLRSLMPEIVRASPDGILLLTTNPVDVLTYAAVRTSGLPASRVIGSGTTLDTARFRAELARHYGLDPRNVHAYVLGEHGDSEVAAWSAATIAGLPVRGFCRAMGMSCTSAEMEAIAARVREAAYEIIRRKGATYYAIGAALARIIEAIARDEGAILTVSSLVDGPYGLADVCLSLPTIVGREGIRRVLPIPLSPDERARLERSAQILRASWESIEMPSPIQRDAPQATPRS